MTDAPGLHPSRARTGWLWALLLGLVLVAAGLIAILQPIATSLATGIILGWVLIAGGVFAILAGLTDLRRDGGWLYVILGLLGVGAGFLVMYNPFAAAFSLVWAIGAWLIVGGILEIFAALSARRGTTWLIVFGLIDIVLGVLLLFMDPISALFFLAIAVGVSFLIRGVALILLALRLRRAPRV